MKQPAGISIVIITYNRPEDMLELVQNIATLEHPELLSEIVIVNNKSTKSYQEVEEFIQGHPQLPFRYSIAPENLGVSRGRNHAIQKSTGEILLFLDDDALFRDKDVLPQVQAIFNEEEKAGIASFKVLYHSTLEMQQTAFAHKEFEKRKDLHHFDTAYFVGCAHAIRRSVFKKTGYYPENFFYGMEEYDLSYRAIIEGFKIVYDDRVVILHKESPGGRLTNKEKLRGMWVNKSKVAWKYLPKKYYYSTAFLWSYEYLRKTSYDLGGFFKGWKQVNQIPATEERKPLTDQAIAYLKKVKARLNY